MRKLFVAAMGLLCAVSAPLTLRAADPQDNGGLGVYAEGAGLEGASADPQTGAFTHTIPFKMLRARGVAQPSLSLTYSSRAGSREAGMGWGLSLPTIERQPLSGWPSFDDGEGHDPAVKDRFAFDGKPLVFLCTVGVSCPQNDPTEAAGATWSFPSWATGAQYFRLQVDGMGARFFFFPGEHRWRVQLRGGTEMQLGYPTTLAGATGPAVDAEANGTKVARYKIARLVDAWGNAAVYRWQNMGARGLSYLTDIFDTSDVGSPGDLDAYAHHVQLDWEPAPAGYTAWTAAHVDRGAMDMRLRRVGVSAAPWSGATAREVVRLYKLEYFDRRTDDGSNIDPSAGPLWNRWFLKSLQTLGKCGGVETDGQITEAYQCWGPLPMTFEYQAPAPVVGGNVIERVNVEGAMQTRSAAAAIDANRDGLPDILRSWSYGAADHREAHLLLRNTSSPVGGTLGFERDCIDGGAPTDLTGLYVREGASADFDADHYKFLGPSGKTLVGSFGDALAMWSAPAPLPQFLPMRLNPTVMAERFCPTVAGWAPKASFKWSFAGVTGWLQPIPDPAVSGTYFVDADGDGLLDEVLPYSVLATGWNNGSVFFSRRLPAGATAAAPYGTAASVRQISFLQEGPMTVMPATRAPEQHGLFKHWYADMDGDGLPELIWASSVNNGGAYTVYPGDGRGSFGCGDPAQPRSPHCAGSQFYTVAGPGISDRNVYFVDVTGDGLADLVVPELGENEGGIRLWINQDGKSFACAQPATACRVAQLGDNCPALPGKTGFNTCLGSNAAYGEGNTSVSFADMNADGVEDMVVIRNDFVWTWSAVRAGGIVPPPASPWAHAPKPGLLTRINDGRGKTVEVKYESAQLLDRAAAGTSSPWSSHLPQATQVVTTIHVANTRHAHGDSSDDLDFKPERWTNYSYRDPAFDPWRQQFVGFRSVSVTTGASMVETQYWHSNCEKDSIVMCIGGTDDDDWRWKSGLPVRIDRRSTAVQQGVRRLSTHFPKWSARVLAQGATASDRRRVWLPFEEDRRTYLYDGASPSTDAGVDSDPNGDSVPKPATQAGIRVELRSTMDVDNHGNTTKRWDFGRTDVADTSLSTISVTCNERNQCLVGSSSLAWPTAPTAAQWVDRSRQYTYGPHGELTTVSTVVDRTSVLDRRHEAGGATAPLPSSATLAGQEVQLAELTYDAYGNVTRRSGPDHIGCASTEYDERYRQLPEVEYTHHVGCGPLALADATGFTWDRGHELPTNVVGPHGDPHVAVYDPFGRLEVFYEPLPETGGLVLAGERFYEDGSEGSPVQRARSIDYLSDAPAQTREVVTIADVLGQPIATYTKYGGLWDVHGYAKYSTEGLPYYSQRPTRTAQDPTTSPTTIGAPRGASADNSFGYLYDDYFRLTTVVDGTVPVASYQRLPLSVSVRDAEQIGGSHTAASTIVDTDGHGRTSRVRQVTAAATITTTRSYLASGEVWKEERTALGTSVARTMVYDSLGRVVENHEPNTEHTDASGTKRFWRYAWDAAGRLVGTSDPRGCGKNVFYDDRSRKTAEDYSPCLASQAPYSPPDLVTGEGAETFYLYDDYEAGQVAPSATFADNAQFAIGRLVAVHDRGAHSRFNYDVRGRVRRTSRRIARPAGAPPGADAYTSHWFVAESEFDNGDRLVSQTTGASAPALMGWGGRSEVSYGYDVAGHLHHVNSSYDGLVAGMQYAPDGQPTDVAYADAASTTATLTYDARRRLTDYALRRPGGSPMWTAAAPPPSYPLPNSQTTQRELTWLHYTRDLVGNPTAIDDLAPQSATTAWPGGAKPVAQRTFAYDDLYRVLTAGYRYMGNALSPNDGQVNPYAKELTEPGSPAPIPRRSVSARVRQQTFAYDHLGNTTSTGDDQSLRFDRSLGAITNGTAHPNQLVSASGVSAKYDPAGNLVDLTVTRPGTCDAGKCAQRFVYEWDEVGQLVRARRWDYTGNTIPAGEPVHPAVPTQAPDRDLRYAYSMGSRVLKTVADETSAQMHTLEVFGSLRVEGAQLLGDDYELNENTEKVYLGGLGRLVYDPTLPSWSGDPKHVFLTMSDHLGSAAFVLDRDSGEVVEKITHQAYGEVESDYRPARWKSQREAYRFTGKEDDFEVGLTYFGARYFHTRLGRWASPDPLTIHNLGADPNPYAYVRGRVSTAVDPFGLDDEVEVKPAEGVPVAGPMVPDDACASLPGPQCASGGTGPAIPPKSPEVFTDGGTTEPEPPVPTPLPEPQTPPEYRLREGPDPGANSPTGPGGGVGRVATRVARDFLIANLYLRLGIAASVVPGLAGPALEGAGAALQAGEVVADAMKTGAGCFTADTEVATHEGARPISEIKIGEEVWSFDSEAHSWRWMTVTAALVHEHEGTLYALAIDGVELRATGNHPVCLTSGADLHSRPRPHDIGSDALACAATGRWVAVEDVRVGDEVLSAQGPTPIRRIRTFELSLPVYNLQVERTHTYAVGATRVLVHNKPAMSDAARAKALARQVPAQWTERFMCKQFANELQARLQAAGVHGTRLDIHVGNNITVYSDSSGTLAQPGIGHSAILVDGIVFDNMRPTGIPYDDFVKDLGGRQFFETGIARKVETPF